jgi:hypothetical protein
VRKSPNLETTVTLQPRSIEIVLENDTFKANNIVGYIYDGKGKCCKFCFDMFQYDKYWRLTVQNKNQIWLKDSNFPKYVKSDYYNRIVINYLIDHANDLIQKSEEQ